MSRCLRCGNLFATASNMRKHLNKKKPCTISAYATSYKCNACLKEFRDKTDYDRHIARKNPYASNIITKEQIELEKIKLKHEIESKKLDLKLKRLEMTWREKMRRRAWHC